MSVGGVEDEGLIYPCSKCDMTYRSASRLRKHAYDVHHDRELVCEICEVKVKTRKLNSFYMHRARCKEITKLEIFKCDQCDFTCQSQKKHRANKNLANHVKAKHEGVLYSCDVVITRPNINQIWNNIKNTSIAQRVYIVLTVITKHQRRGLWPDTSKTCTPQKYLSVKNVVIAPEVILNWTIIEERLIHNRRKVLFRKR